MAESSRNRHQVASGSARPAPGSAPGSAFGAAPGSTLRPAVLLALLVSLTLLACASGPATRSVELDGDASWVLLIPRDGAAPPLAARSVQVLAETRLRALGIERLVAGRDEDDAEARRALVDPSSGGAVLERARADGHRYAVALSIDAWRSGRLPGETPRVGLALEIHDLVEQRVIVRDRILRGGRPSSALSATADAALAALLDDLPLVDGSSARGGTLAERSLDARSIAGAPTAGTPTAGAPTAGVRALLGRARAGQAPAGRASDRSTVRESVGRLGEVAGRADGNHRAVGALPFLTALRGEGAVAAPALSAADADAFDGRATAFFYGASPPLAALAQFDRVVLEPDDVSAPELARLRARDAAAFAYLSVGEVGPERAFRTRIDERWILGRNEAWGSDVMDLAGGGWTAFLDERVDALVAAGYDGLFLDTMDSYGLFAETPAARATQEHALGEFVRGVRARHPSLRLIANRGFEVLDTVGPMLEAVAAESLYARWDNVAGRYSAVPADDRAWLLGQLETARTRHALDVIAIDYVPPARRDEARAVAARIAAHGFVPWVATPTLDHVGVGAIDVLPREVMLLFDSRVNGEQADAEVHRLLATPIEYLGYVAHYHDVATQGLPPVNLAGRFAGIAHWSRGADVSVKMQAWLESAVDDGVPVALFGVPWVRPDSRLATQLGVTAEASFDADGARTRTSDALIGFERPLPPRLESVGFRMRSTDPENRVHLGLEDGDGRRADLVVTGPRGGVAFHPGVVEADIDGTVYWIVDPYAFLRRALRLPDAPMPDVTSESGKRLWMAHIDGDALPSWAELPGRRLGAELIRERILERYPLPHTISVVEAEMTSFSEYDDRRARMFSVMRDIFAMPVVDIATHTFSHPFGWAELAEHGASGVHNLAVDGYRYSPEREIGGSAAFIDERLAPPGKRTRVMLWSGTALPGEAELAAAARAGLVNVNGGFTTITRASPTSSRVAPMARTVGEHVQVYAPIMNENVYTADWSGPFDGYRRVIETFQMTDKPRRLKPLGIYYHFYAGTKEASLRSLEDVYRWSLAQDVQPISLRDYAARVHAFRRTGVARRLDGSWRLSGLGELRSVRVVGDGARLAREGSRGVRTARTLHDGLYLQTDDSETVHVVLAPRSPGAHPPATRAIGASADADAP